MGLVETFMPEKTVEITLSEIEWLIRDKERAKARHDVLLGLCKRDIQVDPSIIYEVFTETTKEND